MKIHSLILSIIIVLNSNFSHAQTEELKQKLTAFASDHEADYEKKYLNIADRELGSIDDTEYEWKDKFMLKSKEKKESDLGRKSYHKFYFSFYAYETFADRQYALKDWMADFIEGQSIRVAKDMKKYEYATPTIILINKTEIMICNYNCSIYSEENFKYWRKTLLKYFQTDDTMVIEIGCEGPLEWTKNAPDPKNRKVLP
tara:strand:- start:101 stop:700 length:600 start_codon:yes stop_codon:yes gene_type:complete